MGGAAQYTLGRWSVLTRFAQPSYGQVEIDNNPVENCIRPTALGKKTWLFIGHPDAGWKPAVLYSVLGTCKLLKINPELYLACCSPEARCRHFSHRCLRTAAARLPPRV